MRSRLSSVLSSRASGEETGEFRLVSAEEWRLAAQLVLEEFMTKVRDKGKEIDATFHVEEAAGRLSIVYHARGGTGDNAINTRYAEGLRIILECLRLMNATVVDAVVDSKTAASLPWEERRLHSELPLRLRDLSDMDQLRRRLSHAAAQSGRASGARGSGNGTKRIRMFVTLPKPMTAQKLEMALTK